MITGPDDGVLMFLPDYMDPEKPSGLWWVADAFDVGTIKDNAVAKNPDASWSEVNAWVDWIAQFPYILVAMPDSKKRDEVIQELTARSPIPVMVVDSKAFYGTSSLRELASECGAWRIERLLLDAEEVPMAGIINIADIDIHKQTNVKRVMSGLSGLDRAIGGFAPGELSVWTGKRGEGKSTLLGQVVLDAVNQNHVVVCYSGELPEKQFKAGLLQQSAGYLWVTQREDAVSGKVLYEVPRGIEAEIDSWWDERLFLTDIGRENAHDEDNIIRLFEYMNRSRGADVFLVDNIMTAQLRDEVKLGFWRAQSVFTGRLMAFAVRNNVHVHLVAHPRKTEGKRTLEADDVGGSGDITNRANNVFKLERVPDETVEQAGYSALLTILKNREFGARDRIKLDFNVPSRRFFPAGGSPAKRYSWELKMRNG